MKLSHAAYVGLMFLSAVVVAEEKKAPPVKPCTIRSPATGAFFDLNTLRVEANKDPNSKAEVVSWPARGYDYGANFTLNFCDAVVESVKDVEDLNKDQWRNVSAYYTKHGDVYSIGLQNSELVLRGRKLVLNYTGGSHCKDGKRRKSTTISLLCDTEPTAPKGPKVSVAFVGTDDNECSYFFEARSYAACAGIETTPQQLGPGGVFGVIMLIALLVYLVGGCVYQRTVMHQRGWRQLPNYSLWSGCFGFIADLAVILTSSCSQLIPSRRGYSRVSLNGNSRGRGIHSDDENRLIDQLDEEWDD